MSSQLAAPEGNSRHLSAFHPPAPAVTSAPDVATLPWAPAGDVAVCRAVLGPPGNGAGSKHSSKGEGNRCCRVLCSKNNQGSKAGDTNSFSCGFSKAGGKGLVCRVSCPEMCPDS